jgi:mono/diheme cytochrome c family protein
MSFTKMSGCLLLAISVLVSCFALAADDGASLFKARCASCHGATGKGRPSAKAPSLLSDKVKSLSDDSIRDLIASRANGEMEKKPAHTSIKKRLTAEQVSAVVAHIRELQKAK